jgi:hypothetical protein
MALVWTFGILGALGVIFVIVGLVATQPLVDFFMGISPEFEVNVDGEHIEFKFNKLEGGTDERDRLFLFKKFIAFRILTEFEPEHEASMEEFDRELTGAGEDSILTVEEFERLKELHEDLLPEKDVRNWIKFAQKLDEAHEKAKARGREE